MHAIFSRTLQLAGRNSFLVTAQHNTNQRLMLCFFKRSASPVYGRARFVCFKHKWTYVIEPRSLVSNASRLYGTTALTTSRTARPTCSCFRTLTIAQLVNPRNLWLLSSLPTPLIPPIVFVGLLLTLWTYKVGIARPIHYAIRTIIDIP